MYESKSDKQHQPRSERDYRREQALSYNGSRGNVDAYYRLEEAAVRINRGKRDIDTVIRLAQHYGLEAQLMSETIVGTIINRTLEGVGELR